MFETINAHLKDNFYQNNLVLSNIADLERDVSEDKLSPFVAAQQLLKKYYHTFGQI
jgi:LAO/AO transport system kinase